MHTFSAQVISPSLFATGMHGRTQRGLQYKPHYFSRRLIFTDNRFSPSASFPSTNNFTESREQSQVDRV